MFINSNKDRSKRAGSQTASRPFLEHLSRDFRVWTEREKEAGEASDFCDLGSVDGDISKWRFAVRARAICYRGLLFDVEVHWSRHHPFEPPKCYLPDTRRNRGNPLLSAVI